MHFVDSNRAQVEQMIRRTISSGMNLILIASFIAAPASIVLLPTLSFAAPMPAPTGLVAAILRDLKENGELSQINIIALKDKSNNSYVTVRSLVNRINHYLALQDSPFRLVLTAVLVFDVSKVEMTVDVVNIKTKKKIEEIDFGSLKNDEPMEDTSLQAPKGVSE